MNSYSITPRPLGGPIQTFGKRTDALAQAPHSDNAARASQAKSGGLFGALKWALPAVFLALTPHAKAQTEPAPAQAPVALQSCNDLVELLKNMPKAGNSVSFQIDNLSTQPGQLRRFTFSTGGKVLQDVPGPGMPYQVIEPAKPAFEITCRATDQNDN